MKKMHPICTSIQAIIFLLFCSSLSVGQERYQIYHFKSAVPLKLNEGRIAVFSEDTPAAIGQTLTDNGIAVKNTQPHGVDGWSLVDVQLNGQRSEDLDRALNDALESNVVKLATPVFVDELGGPTFPTRDILVRFKADVDLARQTELLTAASVGEILERDWAGMQGAYRIRTMSRNGLEILDQANSLAIMPEVRWAEPDMMFTGQGAEIPNDPLFSDCWGLHNIGQQGSCLNGPGLVDFDMDAPEAWDVTTGNEDILVLIIDTGVEQTHPDLNQLPGADFTDQTGTGGGPVNSCDNHGTPVAGCVSAIGNNALGTVGVAPGCKSVSVRTFVSSSACNGGWNAQYSWTADALAWAASIGVRVSNNSNSYGGSSSALEDMYQLTRQNGMIHFASAGNSGSSGVHYPANVSEVHAVAALAADGQRAGFSTFGPGLAFSAPGAGISTLDRTGLEGWTADNYVCVFGTSFASPYTAGVAALILSVDPTLDAFEVEEILQVSSVDLGATGYDTDYGWGMVNANDAVLETLARLPVSLPADNVIVFRGIQTGGSLADLEFSDDQYMSFEPGFTVSSNEAPVWLILPINLSEVPSTFSLQAESQSNTPGLQLDVEVYNFTIAGFETVGVTSESYNIDQVHSYDLSSEISDYVEAGSFAALARVGWRKTGFTIVFPWAVKLDHFSWTITR